MADAPAATKRKFILLCFLPFFQIIAYKVTEDLHRWPKHPLYLALDKAAASKTENYVSGIEH